MKTLNTVNEAIMCKMFRCLPSELAKEDWRKLEMFNIIYSSIAEKNPFFMM